MDFFVRGAGQLHGVLVRPVSVEDGVCVAIHEAGHHHLPAAIDFSVHAFASRPKVVRGAKLREELLGGGARGDDMRDAARAVHEE